MSTCVKRNHENIQDMVGENIDLQNVPKSTSYFNKNRRSYGPLDDQFYFSIPVIFGFADKLTQIVYNIKHSRKSLLLVPIQFTRNTHLYLLLFQCGNVSLNQGPVKITVVCVIDLLRYFTTCLCVRPATTGTT